MKRPTFFGWSLLAGLVLSLSAHGAEGLSPGTNYVGPVPEPASWALLSLGLGFLLFRKYRSRPPRIP